MTRLDTRFDPCLGRDRAMVGRLLLLLLIASDPIHPNITARGRWLTRRRKA